VLDLLGEVLEVGGFAEARANSMELELGGFSGPVLSLEALIRCKRALGRPKDHQVVEQLRLVQAQLVKK
jgi:hypothetical protein